MRRPFFLIVAFITVFACSASGQKTTAFNRIDSTHAFKDITFGSNYSDIKTKLGLVKYSFNPDGQYSITEKTYLTIGHLDVAYAAAFFSKDNFYSVRLFFDAAATGATYDKVLKYFTAWFGKPEKAEGAQVWFGRTMIFSLKNVKGNGVMDIQSKIIAFPGS